MFGSEAKALFASGEVRAAADLAGLDQVFTLWAPQAPRTAFAGVRQLEPGGVLVWERGEIVEQRRWWRARPRSARPRRRGDLEDTLRDSIRLRLRADVPVGAYLSGGLDSSLISALAQVQKQGELRTFSVAFDDPSLRRAGRAGARSPGRSAPRHHVVDVGAMEIAAAFPEVVRHAETPLVRTAPVPLYLLAREVNEHDLKVVVTGEGADELFWGYDLFKEVAIREAARNRSRASAGAARRPLPAPRLDRRPPRPRLGAVPARDRGGGRPALLPPHQGRRDRCRPGLLQGRARRRAECRGALEPVREGLPAGFAKLGRARARSLAGGDHAARALPAGGAGDRVAMAHGVEGRYPFLDHRVYARSVELPDEEKLTEASDKVALRRLADELLPAEIARRRKQPYRAPEVTPFFSPGLSGLGRGGAFAGGARRERDLGRPPGRGPAAALPRRPGHRRARGDGPDRDPVDPALASRHSSAGADAGYPAETADPEVRIDRTVEQSMSEVS